MCRDYHYGNDDYHYDLPGGGGGDTRGMIRTGSIKPIKMPSPFSLRPFSGIDDDNLATRREGLFALEAFVNGYSAISIDQQDVLLSDLAWVSGL